MRRAFLIIVLLVFGFVGYVYAAKAPEKTLRQSHNQLQCAECHIGQKNPAQPGLMSCETCHDTETTVERTAKFGKQNPHTSPHWGDSMPCWVCHKEHSQDEQYCLNCHTWN